MRAERDQQQKTRDYQKAYRQEHREQAKKYQKEYRQEHRADLIAKQSLHYEANREKILQKKRENYTTNKEAIKIQRKQWRKKNQELLKDRAQKYRERNKKRIRLAARRHYVRGREKAIKRAKEWKAVNKQRKAKIDREYMMSVRRGEKGERAQFVVLIRTLISNAFRRKSCRKAIKTSEVLGCSLEQAKEHVGKRPEGSFHLDHICPLGQARDAAEVIKLNHYTNLRWIPATDNRTKHDKWCKEGEEMCRRLLGREWIDKDHIHATEEAL